MYKYDNARMYNVTSECEYENRIFMEIVDIAIENAPKNLRIMKMMTFHIDDE